MGSLLTTLAGCDYIHDDSLARCEYRLHFVYDYNMKFADAFQHEVSQAALFLCDAQGYFLARRDISGTELRSLFSLRSTAFTLEYTGVSFLFTVTGHGHGVGMSQHGANLMAAQGSDYTQILAHYYPGTLLVK